MFKELSDEQAAQFTTNGDGADAGTLSQNVTPEMVSLKANTRKKK